jgi:hypothetical protein
MRNTGTIGVPSRVGVIASACGLVCACATNLLAQPAVAAATRPDAIVVFVDVNVISIAEAAVLTNQTVVVRGDRITAVGASAAVPIPDGARVVAGGGRYVVPGLTDAHVHLTTDMPWAPTRPDFGDAPLYLASGVTTVINLRGTPTQLEWRRRINAGELIGPTIYTAGEFVNEPRVQTPEEVTAEIAAQRRAGYDVIKFHEVWTPETGFVTTTGLSAATYQRMVDAAREIKMPIVGHAPVNLGLEAFLLARQPVAHLGMLSNLYFLPMAGNPGWLGLTTLALALLVILVVMDGANSVARRWRRSPRPVDSMGRARTFLALEVLIAALAIVCAGLFLPGGPLFDSVALRITFTLLVVLAIGSAAMVVTATMAVWRSDEVSRTARAHALAGSVAGVALGFVALGFWVPVAWRSTDAGIERLAARLRDAGISVQTTLVAYDAIGGPGRAALVDDPMVDYLSTDARARWRRVFAAAPAGYRYADFMQKVARVLHRTGVTLVAGTDAMGVGLVAPGSSLHLEFERLARAGLTAREILVTATTAPAAFLGEEHEFGEIAPGKRADLLLVDENPFVDLACLRRPAGVMARGRWFTRDDLQRMLDALGRED